MKEAELIEEGFTRIDVPIEESGDQTDYYYYTLELNPNFVLTSNASDEVNSGRWQVFEYEVGIIINDIEDIQALIALFRKWSKKK
jgi:hypothetical protein